MQGLALGSKAGVIAEQKDYTACVTTDALPNQTGIQPLLR